MARIRCRSNSANTASGVLQVNGTDFPFSLVAGSGWQETRVFVRLQPGSANTVVLRNAAATGAVEVDEVVLGVPAPVRVPSQIYWGGYRGSWDLVDSNSNQWEFVRQHMDGYILHGAYWNYPSTIPNVPGPDAVGPKLAPLVAGKSVILEHLLAGEYPDPDTAFGTSTAGSPGSAAGFGTGVSNIKRLMAYGFPLPLISTDYIMSARSRAVRFNPQWTSKELTTAITGDWDGYTGTQFNPSGSDRNIYGWFRQWVEGLAVAFPSVRVSATLSPVYFNWEQDGVNHRELGASNSYPAWLKLERRGNEISAFFSGDGNGWAALGKVGLDLGAAPLAGIFASSTNPTREAEGRAAAVRQWPFFFSDIGKAGDPGTFSVSGNQFTVTATGSEFIHPGSNTYDAQYLVYRPWTGDGTFTVRLNSLTGSNSGRTNPNGEHPTGGLTLRENTTAGSRQVTLQASLANELEFRVRSSPGGGLIDGSGTPAANLGVRDAPRWLRLVRAGSSITAQYSTDGSNWTKLSTATVNFPPEIQVGLSADSQVRFETATAVFESPSFLPTPASTSYAGTTFGSAGNAGSSLSGTTATVRAAGSGLAGTSDGGRMHAAPMGGDGTCLARLDYFADFASPATALAPGAQLGLTLRATTSAASRHVSIVFTPNEGLRMLTRNSDGGETGQTASYGEGETSIQTNGTGTARRPLLHYFTGNDLMSGLHGAFPGAFSGNYAGFTSDSPYAGYQRWGGSETNAEAVAHRRKIILYERWLQDRGREHHFIANTAGGNFGGFNTGTQEGRDAWDLRYKQDSLRSIQLHQLEGGRPDAVYFESWYNGPYSMVPETKEGSFSNLARDGIQYFRGIGQQLDMQLRAPTDGSWQGTDLYQNDPSGVQSRSWRAPSMGETGTFTVRLVNRGSVAALPVVQAYQTGGSGWSLTYQLRGSDITADITSPEGVALTASATRNAELVAPNGSVEITVNAVPASALTTGRVLLRTFWNPQDPSLATRDAVELVLTPPSELLANGGLEGVTGTTGWIANGGSITRETAVIRTGTGAVRSTRSQTFHGPAQDLLGRLIPGQTYRLTAWVRTDSANPHNVKATVAYTGTSGPMAFREIRTVPGVDNQGWTELTGLYHYDTANGPATYLRLYFEGPPAGVVLFVDDASLTLAGPVWQENLPGTYQWNNGSRWETGQAPRSEPFNRLSFFPGRTLTAGTVTAQQNIATPFLLNALDLAGIGPTQGTANVQVAGQPLTLDAFDGTAAVLTLQGDANVVYQVANAIQSDTIVNVSGDGTGFFQFSGSWSGAGGLDKTGMATLTLSGNNTFSGGVVHRAGSLALGHDQALGTGPLQLAGGSLAAVGDARIITNAFTLTATTTLRGPLHLSGPGALTGGNRTLDIAEGLVTMSGPLADDTPRNLVKNGAGTLVLDGPSSYRGLTVINRGVLRANAAQALGVSTNQTEVRGGDLPATLELAGNIGIAKPVLLAMHNLSNHRQLLNHAGFNELSGTISLVGGGTFWDIGVASGSLYLSGPITNSVTPNNDTWRVLRLHGPGAGTIGGLVSDNRSGTNGSALGLRIDSGSWTFNGAAKNHRGSTVVGSGGTLKLQTTIAFSPVSVENGGHLQGDGAILGSLGVSGTVAPGQTLGVLSAGPTTFSSGMIYEWDLADWNGGAGEGYDTLTVSSLQLTATTNQPARVRIAAAGLRGFSETVRTFTLVTADSAVTAPEGRLVVENTGFPGSGTWQVAAAGHQLVLQYTPAADPYTAWAANFTWAGASSDLDADPDHDGLNNFAEYALDGDPLDGRADARPVLGRAGDRLTLTFRRVADPGLLYEVLASSDVGNWSQADIIWSSTGADNLAGPVTVADNIGVPDRPRRFLRVRMTR